MSEVQACDNCGYTAPPGTVISWLHFDYFTHPEYQLPVPTWTFCSWPCRHEFNTDNEEQP